MKSMPGLAILTFLPAFAALVESRACFAIALAALVVLGGTIISDLVTDGGSTRWLRAKWRSARRPSKKKPRPAPGSSSHTLQARPCEVRGTGPRLLSEGT